MNKPCIPKLVSICHVQLGLRYWGKLIIFLHFESSAKFSRFLSLCIKPLVFHYLINSSKLVNNHVDKSSIEVIITNMERSLYLVIDIRIYRYDLFVLANNLLPRQTLERIKNSNLFQFQKQKLYALKFRIAEWKYNIKI